MSDYVFFGYMSLVAIVTYPFFLSRLIKKMLHDDLIILEIVILGAWGFFVWQWLVIAFSKI